MFVFDQCHSSGGLSAEHSDSMQKAFELSASLRIGLTKTILSHPQCVLWYFYRSDAAGKSGYTVYDRQTYAQQFDGISGEYFVNAQCRHIHSVMRYFERERGDIDFVRDWQTQSDWIVH